ncbi:MAG: CvpA family protein [Candidatus Brocadiia bacterium]
MLDFFVIIIILGFAGIGYLRGILRESLTVGALIVSYFAGAVLAPPFAELVMLIRPLNPGVAYAIGRAAGGLLAFFSLAVTARIADQRIGRGSQGIPVFWNRFLGLLGGFGLGCGLAIFLLCVADALEKAYPASDSWQVRVARKSRLANLVSAYNPADRLLLIDYVRLLNEVSSDPNSVEELKQEDMFRQLLERDLIQEILADDELMEAIRTRELAEVARDPRIRQLLRDEELREIMFSPEMKEAVRRYGENADKEQDETTGQGRSGGSTE